MSETGANLRQSQPADSDCWQNLMTEENEVEVSNSDSSHSNDSLCLTKVNFKEMTNLSALKQIVRSKRIDKISKMKEEVISHNKAYYKKFHIGEGPPVSHTHGGDKQAQA